MIFPSSLMGWLAKANPGNAKPDGRDGVIGLEPLLNNCGRFPFPITKTTSASGVMTSAEKTSGSIIFHRLDLMATAIGVDVLYFPEGIWDVQLQHRCVVRGGTADLTSDMTLLLQVADSGATRFALLNQLVNSLTLNQVYAQNFTLTVTKEIPTSLRLQSSAGLGTGSSFSLFSMIASRIY